MNQGKIVPVILSGGAGTRLWPMSVTERPKQFLALSGSQTMFEQTLQRVRDNGRYDMPVIVANATHARLVEEQLAKADVQKAKIILEPVARNTAPAIALAAIEAGDALILVMPSDHVISDEPAFQEAIERAMPLARLGWLITFGIAAERPETGYGYIKLGEEISAGVHRVQRFIEKPEKERAEEMLAEGGHAWNGGIFLFSASAYCSALAQHSPEMLASAENAMNRSVRVGSRISPDISAFEASPADSIDYAVMEKADRVAVVPVSMGWSDLGSWDAIYDLNSSDGMTNVTNGDVRIEDCQGNLVRSSGPRISMVGVNDLIVIATGDEVMILPRGKSQVVKKFSS